MMQAQKKLNLMMLKKTNYSNVFVLSARNQNAPFTARVFAKDHSMKNAERRLKKRVISLMTPIQESLIL